MLKVAALGFALAASSTVVNASQLDISFTDKDMVQDGSTYSYSLESANVINASVLELDINVNGTGVLTSKLLPTCTQWLGDNCVGSTTDIWHSEFLHEVDVAINCNGKPLYQKIQNNTEFTNEEITETVSHLNFNYSTIKLNPVECSQINVNIRTINGADNANITGLIRFKNSTSTSISNSKDYGVSL